jgi:hypothetical protein
MAHKITSKFGVRFLGNVNHKEVHEVAKETRDCQISEILSAGHAVGFRPDTGAGAQRTLRQLRVLFGWLDAVSRELEVGCRTSQQ